LQKTYRLDSIYICAHPEKETIIPTFHGSSAHACKWCGLELPEPKPKMGWKTYEIKKDKVEYHFCVGGIDRRIDASIGIIGFGGIRWKNSRGRETYFVMETPTPVEDIGPWTPVSIRFWEELP